MILAMICIVAGLVMEVCSAWVFRRRGMSGIPLIPPIAIAVGALTYPDVPIAVRWAVALVAFGFHFGIDYLYYRGILKLGERPKT